SRDPLGGQVLPTPDLAQLRRNARFVAGVRPHRTGGINLALETIAAAGKPKYLIHNYRHSGAGNTLSWGCAALACDQVKSAMDQMGPAGTQATVAVIGIGAIGLTVASELRRKWPTLPITVYAKTLDVTKTTSYIAGGQFEPSQIFSEYQGAK